MARETVRTNDAELYVGWPTTDEDDPSVQVGVRYDDHCAWAVLTSPDQVADLRRLLQRASRRVWPQASGGPIPPGSCSMEREGPHELVISVNTSTTAAEIVAALDHAWSTGRPLR